MNPPPEEPSLAWGNGVVLAVDQRALPHDHRVMRLADVGSLIEAIKELAIRGAPAIGLAGALGVALSAHAHRSAVGVDEAAVRSDAARLAAARPTAVNLAWGVERALRSLGEGPEAVLAEVTAMLEEDAATNRAAAVRAADVVESLLPDRPLRVLTHCNTGRLATAAVGTALGAILELAARGRVEEVLVDETRPLLQGARLTAWELDRAGVPYRLCVDSAAAASMSRGMVDCVLVGADRIAANGDTANKIGTYGLAVAAARHGIPFLVVAPESSWDRSLPDGTRIIVEERAPGEVTAFAGTPVAPAGAAVYNPAFDVTPAELITSLVSERAAVRPAGAQRAAGGCADDARDPTPSEIRGLLDELPGPPAPGASTHDLTRLYAEPGMLARLAARVVASFPDGFDRVLAPGAGGSVVGAAVAACTGRPFTVVPRTGELPAAVRKDAIVPGERVLYVDDLVGSGGTLEAAARLVAACGGQVAGLATVVGSTGADSPEPGDGHRRVTLCEVPA